MAKYSFESVRRDYRNLWAQMKIRPEALPSAQDQARRIIKNRARYELVQTRTGVPWFVIGALHMRESNANFSTWLHNGDPMKDRNGRPIRTVHVPANRPPNPAVSWEEGAYDAIVVIEHLDLIKDWGPERVAYAMEKFNGFGYRSPSRNIPSPYLWGGTTVQKRGKFIRDGVYDPNTMDPQIGGMAVLRALMDLDSSISFTVSTPSQPEPAPLPPPDVPEPASPRADDIEGVTQDEVRPATKSKTVWGAVISWLMSMGGSVAGLFQYLDNPYTLSALVIIIIVASVGLWLVLSGRLELAKLVDHLQEDK